MIAKGRDTRSDKSLRHIAATSRLVCTAAATRLLALILSLRSVARIQTSLNSCDRSQRQNSVAATMIFTCYTRRFVATTCRGDVSQRFVASCVSALTSHFFGTSPLADSSLLTCPLFVTQRTRTCPQATVAMATRTENVTKHNYCLI